MGQVYKELCSFLFNNLKPHLLFQFTPSQLNLPTIEKLIYSDIKSSLTYI